MAACSVQATLANILQRLQAVEDNQSRSNAAIFKLRLEVESGLSCVKEVEYSHERALKEINNLLQRFGDQLKMSQRKEQEKLRAACACLCEEIEEERNMCRLLKLQNKKLLKELEEANIAAADAEEELHRERQARELMEEVCNELAKEIGEDKAEVEQLKHEHAKSREKVEQELKMMRMASMWKDERVKTNILEVQHELDDRHHKNVPIADLKSRRGESVSILSESGHDSSKASANVHIQKKDEKWKKNMTEQAKLLRCALEVSMRQIPGGGGGPQVQANLDFEEEKTVTPVIEDKHSETNVFKCFLDEGHGCEIDEGSSSVDYVDLQVRHRNHLFHHSKKHFKYKREPQVAVECDGFDHNTDKMTEGRKHLHDIDVEFELGCRSRQTTLDSASVNETSDQNLLSLYLQGTRENPEKNADLWEDDIAPTLCRLDDASQVCIDDEDGFSMREQYRRCTASYGHTAEKMDGTCSWKSLPGSCQGHLNMIDDRIDHDTQFEMHHYACKDVNSVRADVEHSCEDDEPGEFDGFYFEPVVNDDELLEDNCRARYPQETDLDTCKDAADHEDEHGMSTSEAYGSSAQQSISLKELACNPLPSAGVKWRNAESIGISSMASCQDNASLLTLLPPHKLVLPTLNAIRASGKSQYIPCRNTTRSVSPSKPQVLQCFRPLSSSSEHETAKLLVPDSNKCAAKGEGVEGQHSGGSSNVSAFLPRPSFNKRPVQ